MLSLAVVGMAGYGLYSAGLGAVSLVGLYGLDWWAGLALVCLGLLLLFSSVIVRLLIPGGLALAASALLALEGLSFHNDFHFYGRVFVFGQVVRAVFTAALLALAYWGAMGIRRQAEEAGTGR